MSGRNRHNRFEVQLSDDGMAMLRTMKQIFFKDSSTVVEKAIFTLYQSRKEKMADMTNAIQSRIEDDVFKDRSGGW